MDELAVAEKPKRRTGTQRAKRRAEFLMKDVAALENLVETLLTHLEAATRADITEQGRERYRRMVNDIRAHLRTEGQSENDMTVTDSSATGGEK